MRYVDHVADLVGNTPLVRLGVVAEGIAAPVLAKVEYFNPGGSVKDRIALRMVEAAEASGELRPGGTIVEPTSGNTGVGLAMVAQRQGLPVRVRLPGQGQRGQARRAARVRRRGRRVPDGGRPRPPRLLLPRLRPARRARSTARGSPNQYANPHNPESHYLGTGPEIWEQTDGRITHFVAGIGTGGTITAPAATSRRCPTAGCRWSAPTRRARCTRGGTGRPYLVEGVGEDFWPSTYDKDICDRIIAVSDGDSFAMTRRLAREEALLVGGSCGMAVVAALRVAAELPADAVVVVLLPDGGRGYLGKVFNDRWMAELRLPPAGRGRHGRRRAPPQGRRDPRSRPRAPERDRRRRRAVPAGVPRLADAGGAGRAAGDGGRGGRRGRRARPARRAVHRPRAADGPARAAHVRRRCRRSGRARRSTPR